VRGFLGDGGGVGGVQLPGLLGGGPQDVGPLRRAARTRAAAALVHLIEDGRDRIVVGLGDDVVLVVVALGAADGQAEKVLADQLGAFLHVVDAELFVDRTAFGVLAPFFEEGGGQQLLAAGMAAVEL